MSLFNSFKLAGGAMQAQTTRLNTVASNLANVDTAAGDPNSVYQARKVVFEAVLRDQILWLEPDPLQVSLPIECLWELPFEPAQKAPPHRVLGGVSE